MPPTLSAANRVRAAVGAVDEDEAVAPISTTTLEVAASVSVAVRSVRTIARAARIVSASTDDVYF